MARLADVLAQIGTRMAYTRKLYSSRGTHMLGIPQGMVQRMGAGRGTIMVLSQPFSGSIIMEPVVAGKESAVGQRTRELGWIIGRSRPERDLAVFGVERMAEPCGCVLCGLWDAVDRVGRAPVCQLCMKELACAVWLRQEPSQAELLLKRATSVGGVELDCGNPEHQHGSEAVE